MSSSLVLIELGAVVVGLAIMARLASRLGFSPIPLYLLAGLAFGEGGLFPVVTAERFIETGAEIGVILLLLMLGLEYSAEELTTTLRSGTAVGLVDLALNFTPGLAAGFLLGWGLVPALLLGGVTYISSSGVAAKLLIDLGWVGNRETPTVLSVLVIEDLVMAVYLPVMAVILLEGPTAGGVISIAAAVGAVALILLFALRYGGLMSRLVFSRSDEALLLSILGTALVVAGVAEHLRVSAAVGAFLVGIGLSGPAADRARSLLGPLRDLFGAVFFVFFALEVDPAAIVPVLGPALVLAVVAAATKFATGWLGAARAGVRTRGRVRAGVSLVSRGEFSIAIAALGVSAGADPRLGPFAAAFVVILAVTGPLLARVVGTRAERTVAAGSRLPETVAE